MNTNHIPAELVYHMNPAFYMALEDAFFYSPFAWAENYTDQAFFDFVAAYCGA